jgi:hypothetical protein
MSSLTDTQIASAIDYNARNLYGDKSPYMVGSFWLQHTLAGQDYAATNGLDPQKSYELFEDPSFMVSVLSDKEGVQDFLYSEIGDEAVGSEISPATRSERDGKFGGGTYRRMQTYLESLEPVVVAPPPTEGSDEIIIAGEKISVEGVRVITFEDPEGLSITDASKKGYRRWGAELSKANHIAMLHWDVCLSAQSCFRVLVARGYASCFGVDNPTKEDGIATVYQWLDPGVYRAAHGGKWPNRRCRSSVDLSNAVSLKYASRYEKMVGIPRPVIKGSRNNGVSSLLGMYKAQLLAWLRVERALGDRWGMQPWLATGRAGKPDYYPACQVAPPGAWENGDSVTVRTHLEYTAKKWDVAGYQEQLIVLYLMDSDFRDEFPWLKANFKLEESFWGDWLEEIKQTWTWGEVGI